MKISLIFGTRPEAIKLCPLIRRFREEKLFEINVCVTGQHRQMLDQILSVFDISPDVDLNLMQPRQSLGSFTARAIKAIDNYLVDYKPDLVVVQGDTTTTFCASLAAFYSRIPVAHVEAGLRTGDKSSPFPEELNRVLTTHLSDYHFVPTLLARDNLINENVAEERIFVSGNTVIDALLWAVKNVREKALPIPGLPKALLNGHSGKRMVLITGHRRENFGPGFESICRAILKLSCRFADVSFVYPVHMNPNVMEPVYRLLGNKENIHLIDPLDYLPFVRLMDRCYLVLTDSGGVQEEAPSLGKPVLVMRNTTERPEGVEAGTAKLVGTDCDTIVRNTSALLEDQMAYESMSKTINPYGDGNACAKIVRICSKILQAV